MKKFIALIVLLSTFISISFAQIDNEYSSSAIYHKMQKLANTGRVMYLAAHPDDENTRLITFMANEWDADVTYLSLTRGDGGQNLVGPELREALGIIRTQELLKARNTDGGKQRFSRANDFGYSKHHDETFNIWDKDEVLKDVIRAIRIERPNIIITRFDTTGGHTHGHHTASAKLALEAFELANDHTAFVDDLGELPVWKTDAIYWNAYSWRGIPEEIKNDPNVLKIDMGGYNSVLGKSYSEIAAISRSHHKSQGFGSTGTRGEAVEYLKPWKKVQSYTDFKNSINKGWADQKLRVHVQALIKHFDFANPANSLPKLLEVRELINSTVKDESTKNAKIALCNELIADCLGLYSSITTDKEEVIPGEKITLQLEATNRSEFEVELKEVVLNDKAYVYDTNLAKSQSFTPSFDFSIPENTAFTQAYWLKEKASLGMYTVNETSKIGLPEDDAPFTAGFVYRISVENKSYPLRVKKDLHYKTNDRVKGEVHQPLQIVPKVVLEVTNAIEVITDSQQRAIELSVIGHSENIDVVVKPHLPATWTVEPQEISLHIDSPSDVKKVQFNVIAPNEESVANIWFSAEEEGKSYDQSLTHIHYEHIPHKILMEKAAVKAIKIPVEIKGSRVLYIRGAGDQVAQSIRYLGYDVDEIDAEQIGQTDLNSYDTIVLGIRAFNTQNMDVWYQSLMEFVEKGGTYVVQYNTIFDSQAHAVGPYPLTVSRDRVTDENALVRFLAPSHEVLNQPNKISSTDFENWVQERGLYFPNQWDDNYTPILGMADKGEDETSGSLIVTQYGEGYFVYTGLSFFRELPAAVPGAYKLMANILSLGH